MKPFAAAAVFFALGLTGCATTSIETTWKKPGLEASPLNKVAVFAGVRNEATRRRIEDKMAAQVGIAAVPSYSLVSPGATNEELRAQILQSDFDGIIVMRLLSVEKEEEWVPGTWSGSYYDFGVYDPGYVQENTYVRVETNVYQLPGEQLIWAATSKSVNPTDINRLIDDTVKIVRQEMGKQGLLPSRPVARAR